MEEGLEPPSPDAPSMSELYSTGGGTGAPPTMSAYLPFLPRRTSPPGSRPRRVPTPFVVHVPVGGTRHLA